ncbi:hypothetical protein LUZ61_008775 [Rhynchospora tenuis]|uniref:non-specific serine/threonine protein kinase n=1 Tax=Rhynchospora tenuis TaxID=198213 RepID=A0AAD6EXY0_9POAL|nr:hypothetical protein LUZ61_008775 [Rhynchospora tenuis]
MDKYEDLGAGNFEGARKMRNRETKELVSVKFIPRGHKIDEYLEWRILNHRSLTHPNVIRFKEVVLTPTHLAIVLEHAADGALFDRISNADPLTEDEARCFFQQLICGVSYCHFMQICNQDLKLDNVLLNGNHLPQLKICDFDYTKSSLLYSSPQLTVGKLAYIAPEVIFYHDYSGEASKFVHVSKEVLKFLYKVEQKRPLLRPESDLCFVLEDHIQALSNAEADLDMRRCKWFAEEIDRAERHRILSDEEVNSRDVFKEHIHKLLATAELADVWSCGVTLCLMLVGASVFEDPDDPENLAKTTERIMLAQYKIPDHIHISQDCQQLLARIFVADPDERIKIQEIRQHPWFMQNLPQELSGAEQAVYYGRDNTGQMHYLQTEGEIIQIVNEARNPLTSSPEVEEEEIRVEVEEEEEEEEEEDTEEEEEEEIDWLLEMYEMPHAR